MYLDFKEKKSTLSNLLWTAFPLFPPVFSLGLLFVSLCFSGHLFAPVTSHADTFFTVLRLGKDLNKGGSSVFIQHSCVYINALISTEFSFSTLSLKNVICP